MSHRPVHRFLIIGFSFFAFSAAPVQASEMDILLRKLVEKGILTQEEAREVKEEVRQEVAQEKEAVAAAPVQAKKPVQEDLPGWVRNTAWAGDLRLRHETQFRKPAEDRSRERFRLRFGFTTKPWDPLEIGVRLATGASGDPVSTNQSFTSTFDKKSVFIDKAYVAYTPWKGISLTGGKMEIPFYAPTQIVWDSDVTPEGAAIQLRSAGPLPLFQENLPTTPFLNIGAFQISELNGDAGDPAMFGVQLGKETQLPGGFTWTSAVAYYEMTGVEDKRISDITQAGAPSGNSTAGPAGAPVYRYDYDVVDFLGKLEIPDILGRPVALIGNGVFNPGAEENNSAWQAGVKVGKVSGKLGSWELSYFYKKVEPDAVLGAITDSDFGGGGTNHQGHSVGARIGLNKYADLGVTYHNAREVNGAENDVDTLQIDSNLKF
ncbi:MAG: putative porin [Candidatus Omnitrophica bacterium]|nr:putative porin [Candidatus Omnitrophota bacterium]